VVGVPRAVLLLMPSALKSWNVPYPTCSTTHKNDNTPGLIWCVVGWVKLYGLGRTIAAFPCYCLITIISLTTILV
jgi:hypothetical protein